MVFLEGNHSEPEIVSEKVLLSVTLGGAKYSGTYMFYCRCLFFYVTLLPKILFIGVRSFLNKFSSFPNEFDLTPFAKDKPVY